MIQKSEVSSKGFKAWHHHSVTDMRLANLWSVGLDHVRLDIHTCSISVIFTIVSGPASVVATANFIYLFFYFFSQPVKFMFTVVICAAELGHIGRRSTCVCHVDPPFDAYFHIRRGAQRKATATVVPPSRDLLTTFCTYLKKKQQQHGHKMSVKMISTVWQQVKKVIETIWICGLKKKLFCQTAVVCLSPF